MAVDEVHVERLPIIDTDVHTSTLPDHPDVLKHMSRRWQDYMATFGFRDESLDGDRPRQRAQGARTDAWMPDGGAPGTDPDFVRAQHLDRYDVSGAIMNEIIAFIGAGSRPFPDGFAQALCRGYNEVNAERWLASDPRWYASINLPYEVAGAEEEIRRCRESEYGDRYAQVLMAPDNTKPAGHQRYWPIYEACEHYGIPVAFHVLSGRTVAGVGVPNYYLEEHTDFAGFNFPLVASMIFEGVFERFPKLKVGLIELGWSWVVPYAWRLDHAYELMRDEVSHVPNRPSEYLAEHFWFSTQPTEEPENLEWFDEVYQLFEDTVGDKLMYSSDYPHWDFDEPANVPATLSTDTRRKILGETASKLYNIPLKADSGLAVEVATV